MADVNESGTVTLTITHDEANPVPVLRDTDPFGGSFAGTVSDSGKVYSRSVVA